MLFKFFKFDRTKSCRNVEASFPTIEPPVKELPENVGLGPESAMEIIVRWGSTVSGEAKEGVIFNGHRSKIDQYLQAVDEIQRYAESATILEDRSNANSTIQIAMARLEDEFLIILTSLTSPMGNNSSTDPTSSTYSTSITDSATGYEHSSYTDYGAKIKETIDDLRSIAKRMYAAGRLHKCVELYSSARQSFLDSTFRRLGIQKLSIDDVRRMEWEALEMKIRQWKRAAKTCVRILFASEKRLCEQIFEGLGTATDDECFVETVKGAAFQLFNFAEAISTSRRSPERLFKILDLHKALSDLLPCIDAIFQSEPSEYIFIQAAGILPQLAEAARGILSEFENAVLNELSNNLDPRGRIHPLTIYVMNYITQISRYKETLSELIKLDIEFAELEGRTPLAVHLIWIIESLQFKLEGKCKCYEDGSLAQLFMVNNVHYIVQKIEESPVLLEMIGDNYLEKLTENVRQAVIGYQRSTWDGVFYCLRDEGLHMSRSTFSSGVSKSAALKEKLKTFNAMFEEVHRAQATWLVPDLQLRKELRLSISEELISAYRSFLGHFESHIGSGKQRKAYIRYSVEALETAISNLFEGHPYTST